MNILFYYQILFLCIFIFLVGRLYSDIESDYDMSCITPNELATISFIVFIILLFCGAFEEVFHLRDFTIERFTNHKNKLASIAIITVLQAASFLVLLLFLYNVILESFIKMDQETFISILVITAFYLTGCFDFILPTISDVFIFISNSSKVVFINLFDMIITHYRGVFA